MSRAREGHVDCIAVLVMVSAESLKSRWVPYEIGHASALWQWDEKPGYRVPRSPLGVSNIGGVSKDG